LDDQQTAICEESTMSIHCRMSFDPFTISPSSESGFEKSLSPVTIYQHLIK